MRISAAMLGVFAFLGIAFLIVDVAAKGSDKKAIPPKPEELVGVWIGSWEDGDFTRLELRSDTTGDCAFVAPAQSVAHEYGVQVYRVTRWTVNGWNFIITLTPAEARLEKVYLKGEVGVFALELEVGGVDRKWKQKLVLHKESQIQESNLETKRKIEEAQK
jgi:hypothetical protein